MTYLKSKNPDIGGEPMSVLDAAPASGATSITVENNQGFSNNDYIVIGNLGTEVAEIVRVNAGISGNTVLTITALKFAHVLDEPVQRIPYNQVKFYVRTSYTAADSLIVTMDIDPTAKDNSTTFRYDAGLNTDWFSTSWYNSNSSTETTKTEPKQADPMYCSVSDVEAFMVRTYGSSSDVPFKTVYSAIVNITQEIDGELNSAFRPVSIPTSDYEYHDGQTDNNTNYMLNHTPVLSVESLQTTQNDEDVAAGSTTWNTLTQDDDFFIDKDTGRVALTNSDYFPTPNDRNRFRAAYTYGYKLVPADIKKLCVLKVAKTLILGALAANASEGRLPENVNLQWLDAEIRQIVDENRRESRSNT